ncbi:MAG TPA: hypothetical protein DEF89_00685 [Desulfosporosinus sp.]|nr:MAG: hypothetical protein JL57_00180 [Desulfosporosinus sp. BICA1-9]HBW33959.1 hypothetical protein [Desulfosporosinus sp.]
MTSRWVKPIARNFNGARIFGLWRADNLTTDIYHHIDNYLCEEYNIDRYLSISISIHPSLYLSLKLIPKRFGVIL